MDRFRNPAEYAFQKGLPILAEIARGERDFDEARPVLQELLRLRALQYPTAEEAVAFLKDLNPVEKHSTSEAEKQSTSDLQPPCGAGFSLRRASARLSLLTLAEEIYAEIRESIQTVRENEQQRRSFVARRMA